MGTIGALIIGFVIGLFAGVFALGLFQMIRNGDDDVKFFLEDRRDRRHDDVDSYYNQFHPPTRR